MDRTPLRHPVVPAYPDRGRARALAIGLLALGGTTFAGADLSGCGARHTAPATQGALRCSGDQAAPAPADPGATTATPGSIRGDMPAVEPEPDPVEHIDGELQAPAPAPEEQVPIPGGMPAPQEPPAEPAPSSEEGEEGDGN
jgi:hypothetical protein